MSDMQLSAPAAKAALSHLMDRGAGLSTPFAQPVKIVDRARLAGSPRILADERLVTQLPEGTRLELRREPSSRHDPWAIRVLAPGNRLVGYIPADVNEILARLMDAGKLLYATVAQWDISGAWDRLYVEVYLDD